MSIVLPVLKIYFDMGGVLADFAGGVDKLAGMKCQNQEETDRAYDDKMREAAGSTGIRHFSPASTLSEPGILSSDVTNRQKRKENSL